MQKLNNEYYVYRHTFANGKVYIGKGIGSRSSDFRQRSVYWKRLYCKHGEPDILIVCDKLSEEEAFELEEFCIAEYIEYGFSLGDTLVNFTLGGEGASGYEHTQETKEVIAKHSADNWKDEEYRERSIKALKGYHKSAKGKATKSRTSKEMWKNEDYRKHKLAQIEKMWNDPKHINAMRKRMSGSNNPAARRANIYQYPTGELIAANVVSAEWARENGYSRPKLQVTAKADRSKPSTKDNPHHHKKVYMEYIDEK